MKARNKKSYKKVTIVLSVAAVALLAFGSVGGARAAIVTYSGAYRADLETQTIGVSLTENGKVLEDDKAILLQSMVPSEETLKIGAKYNETVGVQNTGTIDEYVRITLHRYWTDGTDKKINLSPALINWEFNTDDWIVVGEDTEEERNDETVVLYYRRPLEANGDQTEAALTSLTINNDLYKYVSREQKKSGNTTVITTKYAYDGISIGMDAEVNSVQTHNAHDAILSAWGVDAEINGDGIITAIN